MSMTKIQKELLGALIGLARSVDGRGEAAKGESQEFSSGDSNGHRPDKATHEILLGGICAANPEKELREEDGKSWIARVEAEKNRLNPDCAVQITMISKKWRQMNRRTGHEKSRFLRNCFRWQKNCSSFGKKQKSKTKNCRGRLIFCIRHCLRLETMSGKRVCRVWCRR